MAAINGQYMVFLNKRPWALAVMEADALTPELARLVKTIVIDHTRTLLSRLSSGEGPHTGAAATGGTER